MILADGITVEDDFDPAKLSEEMVPQAKEIMEMLDNRIFIIEAKFPVR